MKKPSFHIQDFVRAVFSELARIVLENPASRGGRYPTKNDITKVLSVVSCATERAFKFAVSKKSAKGRRQRSLETFTAAHKSDGIRFIEGVSLYFYAGWAGCLPEKRRHILQVEV